MPTAQELYDKYMRWENSEIDHETISMFGYYASEILEALELWEKSKVKTYHLNSDLFEKLRAVLDMPTHADEMKLNNVRFCKEASIKTLLNTHTPAYGTISIQQWPEGLVIYVGGEIRYKSWE